MAWAARGKSGKMYFYQSVRAPDGQVLKRYLGCGSRAHEVSTEVDVRRHTRDAQRREVEAEADRLAAVEGLTAKVADAAAVLLNAVLLAEGWHRHNYGSWRKRR